MNLNLLMNLKSDDFFSVPKSSDERNAVNMKKNRMRKLNKILEIPEEVYSDVPKISLIGFDEMIIENYKGIVEYEEFFIRISTYKGMISINGYNLNLETMTNDDIRVTGKIESFEFERITD